MKITEIKKIGKGQRYALYLDDIFFGVFEAEVLARYCLKSGQCFEQDFFDKLKIENGDYACFNRGLSALEKSMKSEKMLKDYFAKKGYPIQCIDKAIVKLKEYGYIDDEVYCENFIASYKNSKSKRKIKYDLLAKGIDENIIEKKLEEIDEELEQNKALELAKKYVKNKDKSIKTKQKVYNYLVGKGFDYAVVAKTWEAIESDWN